MRELLAPPKSRKLSVVSSPDELPKMTTVPFGSRSPSAALSDAPPADSRISQYLPGAFAISSTM
jgi:hypothetical protein